MIKKKWYTVLFISDFVDKRDNSLAFAAFGAAIHSSFPLAVVKVSPEGLPLEFLICFHGNFLFFLFLKIVYIWITVKTCIQRYRLVHRENNHLFKIGTSRLLSVPVCNDLCATIIRSYLIGKNDCHFVMLQSVVFFYTTPQKNWFRVLWPYPFPNKRP